MKLHTIALAITLLATIAFAEPPPKPGGGPSQQSAEMAKLLASFNLTADQRARYDAAGAETGKKMREIHEGKVSGKLTQDEVLKQALAAHQAVNAAVKAILTPEQYAQWEPLREADHHKIAQAHKARDEAAKAEPKK